MQVLAHNLAAQFTNRQLNITTNQKAKSSEKLSSGYRINRSADDAAGLSISEEMRRQIRGLNKGGTNIQEGISLCQIADGALGEVTSILQRMRQLSIQAYNGTNSKSDRACIQDEIDSCLDGINEIQERTKYNELYVLKNNGQAQDVKNVWVDESYTYTVTEPVTEIRPLPDWLQLNDGQDMTISHDYSKEFSQDTLTSGTMRADYKYTDDANQDHWIKVYFGSEDSNRKDGYEWIGKKIPEMKDQDPDAYQKLLDTNQDLKQYVEKHLVADGAYTGWTTDASDNAACKIDFGNLVNNTSSVDGLYSNMFNLLGTELGFPCGSCYHNNAVRFSGKVDGYEVYRFAGEDFYYSYLSKDELSLSNYKFTSKFFSTDKDGKLVEDSKEYEDGYFGAIKNLYSIPDEKKQKEEAKLLAQAIAKDLTTRVKESLSKSMASHYDRVASAQNNTTLYVYDYRDKDSLLNPNSPNSKMIKTTGEVVSYHTYEKTVNRGYYKEVFNGNPSIQIQGSATVGDSIPLELRSISTKTLGLDGYSINSYKRENVYDAKYEADMEAYRKALANMEYVEKTSTAKVTVVHPPVGKTVTHYVNGEPQHIWEQISPGYSEEKEVTIRTLEPKYHLDRPQPSTVEVYNPSDLSILDNAMDQVSKMRSYFGASQNRLEHAYAANKNTEENTTAAESRIRDTDMAKEMVGFSKNNILAQVGQSMLAQANQSTQGILSLLQ